LVKFTLDLHTPTPGVISTFQKAAKYFEKVSPPEEDKLLQGRRLPYSPYKFEKILLYH